MKRGNEENEWVGLKGKIGGRLLNSAGRRLAEKLFLGDTTSLLKRELEQTLTGSETVLDVGAGSGYYSLQIAGYLNLGKVLCLDSSHEMLELLSRKSEKQGLKSRISIINGEASSSGLEDNSVDMAVTFNVLHELSNPKAAVLEMSRVLRPGGKVIIADFSKEHGHHHENAHGPWTKNKLKELILESGINNISIIPIKQMLFATGVK